jgi:hypothetical protein
MLHHEVDPVVSVNGSLREATSDGPHRGSRRRWRRHASSDRDREVQPPLVPLRIVRGAEHRVRPVMHGVVVRREIVRRSHRPERRVLAGDRRVPLKSAAEPARVISDPASMDIIRREQEPDVLDAASRQDIDQSRARCAAGR